MALVMVFAMLLVLHPTAYASNDVVTDALYNEREQTSRSRNIWKAK